MKIRERIYDDPMDKNGNEKPNKLLGEFELVDGDMEDYSYECLLKSNDDGKYYILRGVEISYENGGTKHFIQKIEDNKYFKWFNMIK